MRKEQKEKRETDAQEQEENITQESPQNILGLSDSTVETLYSQAYRLYNNGKFQDASELFRLLIMIKGKDVKYPLGLAACYHMMKQYDKATSLYHLCGIMDPDSPIYHYHAADCYIHMEDPLSAIIALEMVVKRSGENPEFQLLADRSTITIKSLKKKMKQEKKKK